MRLLVDSGSTKADWIAIDEDGKILFTTQTLGLNPEILEGDEIVERLNDRFDILQNKNTATHLFSMRAELWNGKNENLAFQNFSRLFSKCHSCCGRGYLRRSVCNNSQRRKLPS